MKKKYLQLILIVALSACSTKNISIPNLDLSLWKSDKFGCGEYRISKKNILEESKSNLLSLTEKEISHLLGFPEKKELIGRSEKFYFYSLTGNATCNKKKDLGNTYIRIRFNSLGYSKEILFLQEKI